MLERLAATFRGDGQWLCKGVSGCGEHRQCLRDGSPAPRVEKELPDVKTERGEPGRVYCFCHNCSQCVRRMTRRPRWNAEAA